MDEDDEDLIKYLAEFRDRDVKEIYAEAAPEAAALICGIANGQIPASIKYRLEAAKLVVNRVNGTPVGIDVMEQRSQADELMEKVKRLEQGRAYLDPVVG